LLRRYPSEVPRSIVTKYGRFLTGRFKRAVRVSSFAFRVLRAIVVSVWCPGNIPEMGVDDNRHEWILNQGNSAA